MRLASSGRSSSGPATVRFDYVQGGVQQVKAAYPISIQTSGTPTGTTLSISGPTSVTVGSTAQYTAKAGSQTLTSGVWWYLYEGTATIDHTTGILRGVSSGPATVRFDYVQGGVEQGKAAYPITINPTTAPPPPPSGVTIFVSPGGNDTNPGTQTAPVKTVQRGVQLANQANVNNDVTIWMAAGTYREQVRIDWLSNAKKLTLAGEGPNTVLTGVDDWSTGWTLQSNGTYVHSWTPRWGWKPVPYGWDDYWNWDGLGPMRDRLRRSEMIFVNGSPLTGVLSLSEVSVPGRFYVDENASKVYMRPPSGVSLTGAFIEVGTRVTPLAVNGRHNVTLRNFTVSRTRGSMQDAAIQIANLTNMTVDRLQVSWAAYTGFATAAVNGLQILNSIFSDNGVNAINGYQDLNVLMQDVDLVRNNWRGWAAEHKGFDTVHKWSESRDVTVRRGNFTDNYGHGLWFDGDNHRILVDNVFSARNKMRGAYMELNPGPITVQNSKLCENGFEGVANARTDNLKINNNQIFDNAYWQITGTGNPNVVNMVNFQTGATYPVSGKNMTLTNNTIKGRALAGGDPATNQCWPGPCGWAFWAPDPNIYSYIAGTITSDYNRWYHSSTTKTFRVPDAQGQAVDFATFKALMSTVKANEVHSVFGPTLQSTLSCSR